MRVGTDHTFVFDDRARVDDGVVADAGEGIDDRTWPDEDACPDGGGGLDARGGVNDGRAVAPGSMCREQTLAGGQATDAQDPAQGTGGVIGEGAKPREVQEAGEECLWCIVEEAIDEEACRGGGAGDHEGVAATTNQCDVAALGEFERGARGGV